MEYFSTRYTHRLGKNLNLYRRQQRALPRQRTTFPLPTRRFS